MPGIKVRQSYVAVGVNRVVNAMDWGPDGLVAFGAHHMVAIYDPKAARIVSLLVGHTGQVNCVKWVHRQAAPGLPPGTSLLVSGSADCTIRVWAVHSGAEAAAPWELLATLQGHAGPVTSLALNLLPDHLPAPQQQQAGSPAGSYLSSLVLVSTAGDADVHVWECAAAATAADPAAPAGGVLGAYAQGAWRLSQRLHVGTRMQHAVAVTQLPHDPDWLLLATGGTDSAVHLYLRPPRGQFAHAVRLTGHENWVRSLAFAHTEGPEGQRQLLLVSASQDRYGRVWCVQPEGAAAAAAAATADSGAADALSALITRYAPQPLLRAGQTSYACTLEALLIGHEDWVHSAAWQQQATEAAAAGGSGSPLPALAAPAAVPRSALQLLTTSMDRTMILWKYQASSGLWMNVACVGDAGATCLGYFTGVFSPDGGHIMAHGFTGALHLWEKGGEASHHWTPRHALGGHFGAVAEVAWGGDGGCLASVSEDQTARMFTQVKAEGEAPAAEADGHWCEVARSQIHGHDFSCIAFVPTPAACGSSACGGAESSAAGQLQPAQAQAQPWCAYTCVSGAEEKVLRVLEAPQTFLDMLDMARGSPVASAASGAAAAAGQQGEGQAAAAPARPRRAYGAAVPALGLTNKPVFEGAAEDANGGVGSGMPGGNYTDGPDFAPNAAPHAVRGPPLEEHLAQNTLWPETHKLYGHGNELYAAAASPDGALLASACVAKTAATAAIWVWDAAKWVALQQLQAHTLTVTQLAWSNCGRYLASCSRDRSFAIFERPSSGSSSTSSAEQPSSSGSSSGGGPMQLLLRAKAAHARIVWGIAWSPDDMLLATGSRDESVKIWLAPAAAGAAAQQQPAAVLTLPGFPAAVTAVAFAPYVRSTAAEGASGSASCSYTLAVGLESGQVQLWAVDVDFSSTPGPKATGSCIWASGMFDRHVANVNSISWRRLEGKDASKPLQMATCSDDHSVRVYECSLA